MKLRVACLIVAFLSLVLLPAPLTLAQMSAPAASALPRLVRFGGTVKDLNGSPLTGVVGITFALYSEPTGGAALWLETQNVTADDHDGHYAVLLGSTKPDGLPAELFTSEQARWVGVQVSGQAEQPRVLLVSAPYALKAGDAETIGGLPPSAFVLAAPPTIGSATASSPAASAAESVSPLTTSDVTTTGGTVDAIPLFFTSTSIQNSILSQTGTTAVNVGGKLNLPSTAAATKTAGADSRPLDIVASSFSSSTSTAVNQTFQWQAEPAANDTAAPSGTLNLLYGLGAAAPSETGLRISSKGIVTFAKGQTFPGTGDGSVTSVATGLGLKGGTITKTGTLTIDTTVVPQLKAANTFTANQTVNAILTVANSSLAIHGTSAGASATGLGRSNTGVWGDTGGTAGAGFAGVLGTADGNSAGWFLNNGASATVFAANSGSGYGVYGSGGTGVVGVSTSASGYASGPGGSFTGFSPLGYIDGDGTDGIDSIGGNGDVDGTDGEGGMFTGGKASGVYGDGVEAYAGSGYAGLFHGDVDVVGTLSKTSGSFKIDHPLDPANRYLYHSFVESPDMMNVYNGNIVLDDNGEAVIQMPEWFGVLNRDFRYQLTCIGGFAPVYVAEEINNNRFRIAGGKPGLKISWQVTGIRQDAWANAHRIPVEQEKEARLRGFYLHPELYGAPAEKQIEWARHPQMMKRIKEMQAKQLAAAQKQVVPRN